MRNLRFGALALSLFLASSAQAATPHPVVLELFTSQGCASCPPADALLNDLADRKDILALSYHITYWNRLGWADPLSFAGADARQGAYADALNHDGVYTPQLVVQGAKDVVGSSSGKVDDAIDAAAGQGGWIPVSLKRDGDKVTIHADTAGVNADVILLGYKKHSENDIPRGENSGTMGRHRNSVTSVAALGLWAAGPLNRSEAAPAGDGVAVLVQQPGTGAILGAGWVE